MEGITLFFCILLDEESYMVILGLINKEINLFFWREEMEIYMVKGVDIGRGEDLRFFI